MTVKIVYIHWKSEVNVELEKNDDLCMHKTAMINFKTSWIDFQLKKKENKIKVFQTSGKTNQSKQNKTK